ncbi:MAG: 3'-5' exonuclease [Bacillota bacterium]|nr:3'-5' exonuclease [Bacillota bacterium]
MAITSWPLHRTPFSVVDLETTGLYPGADRIVEISVVRVEYGKPPQLIFDTMVNPRRRMAATEIHGLTDDDVRDAPTFREIASDVAHALAGTVVAAHNVYFDVKFLDFELGESGLAIEYPYLCTMYMRPLLGLGKRCSLDEACRICGVSRAVSHAAGADAVAAGTLLTHYLGEAERRGIQTFGDVAAKKTYKFLQSWCREPFPPGLCHPRGTQCPRKSRTTAGGAYSDASAARSPQESGTTTIRRYFEAVVDVIADLQVTPDELNAMRNLQVGISAEAIRAVHSKVFAGVIAQFVDDDRLDEGEVDNLRRLRQCLSSLGWAPGD